MNLIAPPLVVTGRGNVELPETLANCSDEDLLGRFRRGQREAFGVFVRRYERELYGYLRRYLGDASLADDVFQNTFLQVYPRSARTSPAGRCGRGCTRSPRTRPSTRCAATAGTRPSASTSSATSRPAARCRTWSPCWRAAGPARSSQAQGEEPPCSAARASSLPDFLRQVVILAYYQGLKYREIADILGIPVGTVKSRLHAALVKLQEAWAAPLSVQDLLSLG